MTTKRVIRLEARQIGSTTGEDTARGLAVEEGRKVWLKVLEVVEVGRRMEDDCRQTESYIETSFINNQLIILMLHN